MKEYENQFIAIKDALNSKEPTNKKQVFPLRNVLEWFEASRRGAKITHKIRYELGKYELITEPDFEQANINGTVTFKKASSKTSSNNFNIDPSHTLFSARVRLMSIKTMSSHKAWLSME